MTRRTNRAAGFVEQQESGSLDENAALLAHLWEDANEPLTAARWHQRAANWAGITNAAEGFRHWERVLNLVRDLPETEESCNSVSPAAPALGSSRSVCGWPRRPAT